MDRLLKLAQTAHIYLFLDLVESVLTSTGGMRKIYRAIDSKDLAVIVRTARRALKDIGIPHSFPGYPYLKSVEKSNKFRQEGNRHYKTNDFKSAIVCYNKALAYAPNDSVEVVLTYGNISAVMLTIKAYQACQMNIEAAKNQELECPEFLRVKLEKRAIEANKYVNDEIMRDMAILSEEDTQNYAKFDVVRHAEIPCVSADVEVDGDKDVVAAKEIKSGTMVALERVFVSFQDEINEYISCYYCHKMCFFFIPCKGCCKALFCSNECKEKCSQEYHRVECHVVGQMYPDSQDTNQLLIRLIIRAAIKMSLELGWEKLSIASLEMGEKLFQKSSVAEAFDSSNPTSLLCYDDQTPVPADVMMNRSLVTAMTIHWLSEVPGYLPEEEDEREEAIETLSRIMLHLNTTFMKQVGIPCSAIEYKAPQSRLRCIPEVHRNSGWFSFTSKLAHSCEPNLLVVGFNDTVALVALQRIKKGDQLTISYLEHFYDMNLLPCPKNSLIRQKLIFGLLEYTCECRVCLLEWHSGSHIEATLNNKQKEAYKQFEITMNIAENFGQQLKGIRAALDELSGCINTTQHRNLYLALKKTLNIPQCAKTLNKTYGCVQTLHPYHNFVDYLRSY